MRLNTKLWLLLVISVALSIALFMLTSVWLGKGVNEGYSMVELNPLANSIVDAVEEQPEFDLGTVSKSLDRAREEHPSIRWLWLDGQGRSLYDTAGLYPTFAFQDMAALMRNLPERYLEEDDIPILAPAVMDGQTYYLMLIIPASAMKQGEIYILVRAMKALLTLIVPLMVSIATPFLLFLWFFSTLNRRIRRLNTALKELNIQSDTPVVEVMDSSKDELGQLALRYNSMALRIRDQFAEIQNFENKRKLLLSNLSHDLRTPLTMMLGYAENIRAGNYKNEQELQARARIILQHSRYMDKLLDQMLDISRRDTIDPDVQLANHNVSELLRRLAAEYMMVHDGDLERFEVEIPEADIELFIDASLVERALRNILDNAIRYGKDGRYLGIRLSADEQFVTITVKDRGQGIPPEHFARIFDRFFRVDGEGKGAGLGMGLAIVKDVVLAHKGSIQTRSTPNVETAFQIKLPR